MPSERRRRVFVPLLGASFGLAAGDVLLGLNPHLMGPLSAARLLMPCALFGGALGALAGAAKRPATRRGLLTLVFFGSLLVVLIAETERQVWYAFLPNGARRIFVVTCVAAGSTAFSAVLARWRGSDESWPVAVAFVAFLLAPAAGRRLRDRDPLASPPHVSKAATRSLLVVGIDGASWSFLASEASSGFLPTIARLLAEGAAGPLRTLEPYDRAALYTTAATGKLPRKHGVVSSTVIDSALGTMRLLPRAPAGAVLDPFPFAARRSAALDRRSLTLWEILAARGHGAAVLGWPATRPAREGLVLWASEEFFLGDVSAESARPAETAARANLFHVDVARLDRPLVRSLLPKALTESDRRWASPLEGAARDLSVAGAALAAVPKGAGNVSALVLTGLASVARAFSPAANPAGYFGVASENADARALALRAYYRFLDETIADLLVREGEERTVCVFAPVGYGPPPGFGSALDFIRGREPRAGPDAGADGFVLLSGPGIRRGARLTSASVVDLAPTLLVLAGEPIARDMDGRVLAEAFDARYAEEAAIPVVTTFEPAGPQ
ncbi:MAG TPA: alkaline phosphatase family protein [Thermoanaerobaculia bacterium]|nr:alkaline phosphatase family protein [Thermoanaerobaculia bacterium]